MEHSIERIKLPASKRIFDIIMVLILFLVATPFLLILFIWIALEQLLVKSSRGPIFYSDKRISQGKEFDLYKFRIFKLSALDKMMDKEGFVHTKKLEHLPGSLTLYGRFLKQIYMDEFPQLFNILKGDMTLVDPRPTNIVNSHKLKKAGNYTKEIMKCGLTGAFQSQKGKAKIEDREVDMAYINFCANQPGWRVILQDLKILFKTVLTVIRAKGI